MTTTTTPTPALELAAKLTAIAEHLRAHPHLPYVVVHRTLGLQISAHPNENVDAHAVLIWAKTLTDVSIVLSRHGKPELRRTQVSARGRIGDHVVEVWDVEDGDLWRWRGDLPQMPITVERLAEYVAAGTVEGLGTR